MAVAPKQFFFAPPLTAPSPLLSRRLPQEGEEFALREYRATPGNNPTNYQLMGSIVGRSAACVAGEDPPAPRQLVAPHRRSAALHPRPPAVTSRRTLRS